MSKNVQLQIEELKRTISESEKKISLLKKNIKKEFLKDFIEILEKYNVSLVFQIITVKYALKIIQKQLTGHLILVSQN